MRKISLILLIVVCNIFTQNKAQTIDKQIECKNYVYELYSPIDACTIKECYYVGNTVDTLSKTFQFCPADSMLLYYENLDTTWIAIYGFKNNRLKFSITDISNNTDSITEPNGNKFLWPYKCCTKNYYQNGNLESEGVSVWIMSPIEAIEDVGEWKFYNIDGSLKEVKVLDCY